MRSGVKAILTIFVSSIAIITSTVDQSPRADDWDNIVGLVNDNDEGAIIKSRRNWGFRPHDFTRKLTKKGVEALLSHDFQAVGTKQPTEKAQETRKGASLVPAISALEYENMDSTICASFARFLQYVSQPEKIPQACRKEVYKNGLLPIDVRHIPPEWIAEDGIEAIKTLLKYGGAESFSILTKSSVIVINQELEICELIPARVTLFLSPQFLPLLSPQCFTKFQNIPEVNFGKVIPFLRDDIFSNYNGPLAQSTLSILSPAKISKYASNIPEAQTICGKLDINHLQLLSLPSITPRCLAGFLMEARNNALNANWTELANVFQQLDLPKHVPALLRIPGFQLNCIPGYAQETVFSSPVVAAALPANAHFYHIISSVFLSSKIFANLALNGPRGLAAEILIYNRAMPDDILAECGAKEISNLEVYRDGKVLSFNELIEARQASENIGALIQNISAKVSPHYCSTLSKEAYLSMNWLRIHGGISCLQSLPFNEELRLTADAPEFNPSFNNFEEFFSSQPISYWENLSTLAFEVLKRTRGFTQTINRPENRHILERLPTAVLALFGPSTTERLIDSITSKLAPKLAVHAFGFSSTETFKLKLNDLHPNQIPYLSIRFSPNPFSADFNTNNCNRHVFSRIRLEHLSILDDIRINSIADSQFACLTCDNSKYFLRLRQKFLKEIEELRVRPEWEESLNERYNPRFRDVLKNSLESCSRLVNSFRFHTDCPAVLMSIINLNPEWRLPIVANELVGIAGSDSLQFELIVEQDQNLLTTLNGLAVSQSQTPVNHYQNKDRGRDRDTVKEKEESSSSSIIPSVKDIVMAIQDFHAANTLVDSLIPGRKIVIEDVFYSFLKAISPAQRERLIIKWTGGNVGRLAQRCLKGAFWNPSGNQVKVTKEFCPNSNSTQCQEYRRLVRNAALIQGEILGLSDITLDPFSDSVATSVDGESFITWPSSSQPLRLNMIIQSSGALIHSLAVFVMDDSIIKV